MLAEYDSSVFNAGDIGQAKHIILTPDGSRTTNDRWAKETPYLASLIAEQYPLSEKSTVLDYGCGIGRMSKALIEKFGCKVVGADISPNMRALAAAYVSSDRFVTCDPSAVDWLGIKYDMAIAVWVLQHCNVVENDISRIRHSLRADGCCFVTNDKQRLVPTRADGGWSSDGKDVRSLLREEMVEISSGNLASQHVGDLISRASFWAAYGTKK